MRGRNPNRSREINLGPWWTDTRRIAEARRESHRKDGSHKKPVAQKQAGDDMRVEVAGVRGEAGCSIWCGSPWPRDLGHNDDGWDFKLLDGRTVDVKASRHDNPSLMVSENEKADFFVLVWIRHEEKLCTIEGYATREDVLARPIEERPTGRCRVIKGPDLRPAAEFRRLYLYQKADALDAGTIKTAEERG